MTSSPALQLTGLHKHFGALCVAHEIDFCLQRGARHALIGPNGAGKTTLVNLISGVLKPSVGVIRLDDIDITSRSQAERSHLGLARTFQINQLFRGLTVLENVCLAIAERTGAGRSLFRPLGWHRALSDEALQLLESLQLLPVALKPLHELAYGQQRLVEIAIALGQKPKVLLLDEPAAGVPSSERRIIFDVIAALSGDLALLIIEHDMDVVFRFAERITVMVEGRIFTEGAPQEIANDERVKAVYLGETHG